MVVTLHRKSYKLHLRLQKKLSRTNKRYDTYLSQQKAHQEIPFTVIISQFTVVYSSQSWTETKKTIQTH